MFDKIETFFIIILASPLIAYEYLKHIYEKARMLHVKTSDKLFMKRFNLIDKQHINDFIDWNNSYRNNRT